MALTGAPKIDDALLPYMGEGLWCDVEWRDESTFRTYADGTQELAEARFRAVGSGGWRSLSYADLKQLHGLTEEPFTISPRTHADGDPAGLPELLLRVRRTSPLPETTPLTRRAPDGSLLYAFEFEFEGVETFAAIPEAIYGGFYLVSETTHTAGVERWGDATMTEAAGPTYSLFGIDYPSTEVDLGPEAVTDRLLTETADGLGYVIDFLNDYKAPTEA